MKIGTPKRDGAGNLISSGEDLNLGGITDWCFDVLYVTCKLKDHALHRDLPMNPSNISGVCQVVSAIFGERFWLFYLSVSTHLLLPLSVLPIETYPKYQIPGYAAYKIWTMFISPMVLGRGAASDSEVPVEPTSKRQQKLKARSEKGDSRVKATTVRR